MKSNRKEQKKKITQQPKLKKKSDSCDIIIDPWIDINLARSK